jgi:hypothetical protein
MRGVEMTADLAPARTRRALLAAGISGAAATVAAALGRPDVVRAGTDGDVVLGGDNTTNRYTFIKNTTDNDVGIFINVVGSSTGIFADTFTGIGLHAESDSGRGVYGQSGSDSGVYGYSSSAAGVLGESGSSHGVSGKGSTGYGVYGTSTSQAGVYGDSANHPGVVGHSDNSIGVSGSSPNGTGVYGSSGLGPGVSGYSNATNRAGAVGQSGGDSTGVLGVSGSPVPDAPAKTGVFGEADQDATAKGVWGKSAAGRGVYGEASNGQGVRGYSASGAALYGSTSGAKAGYALRTDGRVRFDKSAGLATVTSGHKTVTVTPGIDLTSTSAVVATLQGNPSGTIAVQAVAVDPSADTFTIYLNATAASDLKVAWHAFG